LGRARTIDRNAGRRESSSAVRAHHTLDRRPCSSGAGASTLTAAEVANLLRSSIRRGSGRNQQREASRVVVAGEAQQSVASVENLVEAAAPIGQEALLVRDSGATRRGLTAPGPNKTAHEMESSVSVI
jgi:solute carrier family 6 (neurotransmitter transporter)